MKVHIFDHSQEQSADLSVRMREILTAVREMGHEPWYELTPDEEDNKEFFRTCDAFLFLWPERLFAAKTEDDRRYLEGCRKVIQSLDRVFGYEDRLVFFSLQELKKFTHAS